MQQPRSVRADRLDLEVLSGIRPASHFVRSVTSARPSVCKKSLLVVVAVVKRSGESKILVFSAPGRLYGGKEYGWRELEGLEGRNGVDGMTGIWMLTGGFLVSRAIFLKMSTINSKILRTANAPSTAPDETEKSVAQALIDLENNVPELKNELRALQISAAREVDVRGGKKAIVIFVPVPQLKAFHKVQQRCD